MNNPVKIKIHPNLGRMVKILLFSLISLLVLITSVNFSFAQTEATDETVPDEAIKENLKQRLEKVVRDQPQKQLLKRAWVGALESIANHTLTIDTRQGPKLASISAETTIIRLPKRNEIKAEDLEIGAYTIAMGYLNGKQVLDTHRVIINQEPPEISNRKVYFVTIEEYDSDKDILVIRLSSQESQIVELNKNTVITERQNLEIVESSVDNFLSGSNAIIIIEIEEEDDKQTRNLLKIHLLQTPEEEIDELPSPIEIDTPEATESQEKELGPELQ